MKSDVYEERNKLSLSNAQRLFVFLYQDITDHCMSLSDWTIITSAGRTISIIFLVSFIHPPDSDYFGWFFLSLRRSKTSAISRSVSTSSGSVWLLPADVTSSLPSSDSCFTRGLVSSGPVCSLLSSFNSPMWETWEQHGFITRTTYLHTHTNFIFLWLDVRYNKICLF